MVRLDSWACSKAVIGACVEVHRQLGPGLLESAYEECLCHELVGRGLAVERQKTLPLHYNGIVIDAGYRLDLVVDDQLIVEAKAVRRLLPIHEAQLITYLKVSGFEAGLLVNFHARLLRRGLRRLTRC